jgi:2'-5' RNA ligase
MPKKEQYWARYDINFHSIIQSVWNDLEDELPSHYIREHNPHITVHPGFQFKRENTERFKHYVYENFPTQITTTINDFYYHPNKYQPMVICLDVDTNIPFRNKQRTLRDTISQNGGQNVMEPKPPHITVYKSKDKGSGYRNIPNNVNQIKTKCKKLCQDKLPITLSETRLVVEGTP